MSCLALAARAVRADAAARLAAVALPVGLLVMSPLDSATLHVLHTRWCGGEPALWRVCPALVTLPFDSAFWHLLHTRWCAMVRDMRDTWK